MPQFTYEALVAGGGRTKGVLEAKSRQEALAHLSRLKLQPLRLHLEGAETGGKPAPEGGTLTVAQSMTENQIIAFTEELGDLLDAGLQLEEPSR